MVKYFLFLSIIFLSGCLFSSDDTSTKSIGKGYSINCSSGNCSLVKPIKNSKLQEVVCESVDSISWDKNIYGHSPAEGYFKVDVINDSITFFAVRKDFVEDVYSEINKEVKLEAVN